MVEQKNAKYFIWMRPSTEKLTYGEVTLHITPFRLGSYAKNGNIWTPVKKIFTDTRCLYFNVNWYILLILLEKKLFKIQNYLKKFTLFAIFSLMHVQVYDSLLVIYMHNLSDQELSDVLEHLTQEFGTIR